MIHMSSGNKRNCILDELFTIMLKQKLFLDIFPPSNPPICIYGCSIDAKGMHVLAYCQVSKAPCHN
jgi:hypothetical protein